MPFDSSPKNLVVFDQSMDRAILRIGPGKKAIHVDRYTGRKVVRLANDDGNFNNYGHIGDNLKILGPSEFVTLDEPLPATFTNHVIQTEAAVDLFQNSNPSSEPEDLSDSYGCR